MSKKIGVLGGSFNPVHNGHIHIARLALCHAGLDTVLFMVAPRPPHKKDSELAPFDERFLMTSLALEGESQMRASDMEAGFSGPSYTLNTIRKLLEQNPTDKFFLIVGLDTIAEIPSWHKPKELLNLIDLITFVRPPEEKIDFSPIEKFVSPEKLRAIKQLAFNLEPMEISSSNIRSRLKNNLPISGLTPKAVENYLLLNRLYLD